MHENIDDELENFAYNLRFLMKQNNITQEELAAKVNTSQTMISRYATGKVAPNVLMLRKLSKVLGCTMEKLFNGKI